MIKSEFNSYKDRSINLFSQILEPPYFYQDYKKSLKGINQKNLDKAKNIFLTAVPFITLHPFARLPLTFTIGISRTINSLSELKNAWNQNEKENIPIALFNTAASTASFACTIFLPSLASFITVGHDLIADSAKLVEALKNKEYKKAFIISAEITNHSLYLSLFFTSVSQIAIASLSLQIILQAIQSYRNFQDGQYLEGFGNALTASLRCYQLKIEMEVYQLQLAIDKHVAEVEKKELSKLVKENPQENEIINRSSVQNSNLSGVDGLSEKKILQKAVKYLEDPEIAKKRESFVDLSKLGSSATDKKIIDTLFEKHQGFCVGENHKHDAGKAFILNNMNYLKNKKVTVLFYEGFNSTQQPLLDKYFSANHLRNLHQSDREKIRKLLEFSANHIRKPGSSYSSLAILAKAKTNGIRIVGIDYAHDWLNAESPTYRQERLIKMNFVAAKTIEATRNKMKVTEKFVAFMGAYHLSTFNPYSVQGVADLTETPAVWIEDQLFKELYSKEKKPDIASSIINFLVKENPKNKTCSISAHPKKD
ncbi:MAG TPA: membrane-targeted effector domain-containing toxin [Parachlamydiaceae bacterium]|nr:membrane-targeted effector domain-containing toxin [Parachlamydiaceae bacterium]